MQEPESRSRPLHAGCRRGSKQVAPRLIPGPHTSSWFRHHLKHFDASTRVRFHSPSRSIPDAVSAASFPRRSPPRLFTGAARGGLLPPPARRQRRACLHLLHSTDSQKTAPTRPADYRSGHTYAAAFFRNSFSIFSSRVSRSSSRSRARSLTVSGGSSPACSRRYMLTQLPRVPSLIPSSFATRAIGREVSITIFTASSLNSGEKLFFGRGNYFTFPDIHPNGWTVRKPRGTPLGNWLFEQIRSGDAALAYTAIGRLLRTFGVLLG